jgi:flagellar biosynthesis protein FlhG
MPESSKTLSISIMSGKGGVGKTNIALNLAYSLSAQSYSTILVDCDLGLANLDVLLGVSPGKNLEDLLQPETDFNQVLVRLPDSELDFLPAASGVPELADWDNNLQTILFSKLNEHFKAYDLLLLDLGAGVSSTVVSLASMTRVRVVVISAEPTSLTDGYALIKVLATKKKLNHFFIVVNKVSSHQEGETAFNRLSSACEKFLDIRIDLLAVIPEDRAVVEAVMRQAPLYRQAPESRAYKEIEGLASKMVRLRQRLPDEYANPLNIEVRGGK